MIAHSAAYDAVIVGSGPNGLAAAIRLAQEHLSVLVVEANSTLGGGARSAELTLPGFIHDLASAVHPLGIGSPFFKQLPLQKQGLEWIQPPLPLAHPLKNGEAVALHRSLKETIASLGEDGASYRRLIAPLLAHWEPLVAEVLRPPGRLPRHPLLMARFGQRAVQSAAALARRRFNTGAARSLWAGLAAHSFLPLEQSPSAAFALVLGLAAHAVGWPIPRGGAQQLADALAAHLRALGGTIIPGQPVESLDQLPRARAIFLDLTPRQVLRVAGRALPDAYRRTLERFRYGPGVFKLDWALSEPIPWQALLCRQAGTVHIGGTLDEIATAEREVARGQVPEQPFVLLAQPSLFDPGRAPAGKHTVWAYCHVPNDSRCDMTERIEQQIERFAPGFRDCILARSSRDCAQLEQENPNLVGGDISGGATDWRTLLMRPLFFHPYRTPVSGLYLCSASTPPGGGVHGMCGFHAAELALRDNVFRR